MFIHGAESRSDASNGYAEGMTGDNLKAVASTLDAVRRAEQGEPAPTS